MSTSSAAIRVLLIQSNVKQAAKLTAALEQTKGVPIGTRHVPSMEEAIAVLEKEKPDVILSELDLPDSLGLDTCDRLAGRAPDVPFLIISANEDLDLAQHVIRAGAEAYLLSSMAAYPAIAFHICSAVERSRRLAAQQPAAAIGTQGSSTAEATGPSAPIKQVEKEAKSASRADATEDDGGGLESRRILIVDDDDIAQDILSECLRTTGCTTEVVSNGYEALVALRSRFLEKRPFHLVLLDLMMPEMNGFEFLQTVRQRKWGKGVPILVSTSNKDEESVRRCRPHKIAGYVLKPFEPDLVLERVREALSEDASDTAEGRNPKKCRRFRLGSRTAKNE